MADINLKTGNTDFVNISDGDITVGNQAQTVSNDEIVIDTPIVNQVISNTDIETTDDVPEGTSNLYYTDARVDERINQADIILDDVYTNADFDARLATRTTDHLTEGSNLYYTDSRSRSAISVQGDLSYNSQTGVISYTTPTFSSDVTSVNSLTGAVVLNTDNINEGVNNLYYTDQRFDNKFSSKSTTDLAEGTNLYYTTTRFNSDFSNKATTDLAEGTNLYFTNARARSSITVTGDLSYNNQTGVLSYTTPTVSNSVNSVNSQTGVVVLDTSHIAENTNLYYTDTRARQSISVSGDLSYDNSTGVISFTETTHTSDVNSVNGLTGVVTLNTDNISEGTNNLYYTDARVDARAQLKIDEILDSAPGSLDTLNELASALGDDPNFATTMTSNLALKLNISDFNSTFDTQLATKTTTNIAEGTNLYFTDARVDTHLNTSNATSGQILNWNGTDYTWVTPTTYTVYTDSDVDTHLNTSSAVNGQVLTWNGTDYSWTLLPSAFDGQFSSLTGTPTTINGYGITDAIYNDSTVAAQPIRQHYANQSSFPSASTWHGAMAHSHSDGAMYYAHNSVWNKLANDSDLKNNLSELNDVNTSTIDNGYLVYSIQSGTHNTQALHIVHDTTPSLGGDLDTNSNDITGGLRLTNSGITETFDTHTGSSTSITLNTNTSHSLYVSNASNNKTLSLTNLSLASNSGTNFTVIWVQGSTPYMINGININGIASFVNWQGGSQPTGTASGIDIISFSIYYTGSTYITTGQSVSYS